MQLYKVKLLKGHRANRSQIHDGYLAHNPNYLALYSRGEALKKARGFGGKIEPHGKDYKIAEDNIMTLLLSEIIHVDIVLELDGMEFMRSTDTNVFRLYSSDIFNTILNNFNESTKIRPGAVFDELNVLAELSCNYTYIMTIK